MRKFFTLFLFGLAVVFTSQAQNKVLANWDGKNPMSVTAIAGIITQDVANPNAVDLNTSAKVLQYDRDASAYSSFKLTFDSTRLLKYPQLLISVYAPATTTIRADVIDGYGDTISLTKNVSAATSWVTDTFDFSRVAGIRSYKSVIIYPDPSGVSAATYYFDDFKLVGLNANADTSVIARETFGNADFRQRGAGGLTPPFNYPDPNWTSAIASVHGATTVYGNDTWYPYTMQQNVPAGKKGLTIKNGNWNTTYGMWVSGLNYLGLSGTYANNSGEGCTLFAPSGRYTFGWDTIQIDNIDISGFNNLGIGFALAWRDAISQNIFTYYKIDGDLTWTQFCDPAALKNAPTTKNVYSYVTTPKLASTVQGKKMSILFRGLETNDNNRFGIDDITLTGSPIAVTDINVSATSNNMNVGDDMQIKCIVSPSYAYDTTVVWSVDNTSKATIDATGKLTAVANGSVVVTATANDGSLIKGTYTITISGQNILVTDIAISGGDKIEVNGGTLSLTATITPSNATDKTVTWSVDKPEIAAIDATGKLTAKANGSVVVTATANDGSLVKGTVTVTVSNQGTGINNVVIAEVSINPNPAANIIVISGSTSFESVEIFNSDGNLVKSIQNIATGSGINVSSLPAGMYMVRLTNTTNVLTKRFVKK